MGLAHDIFTMAVESNKDNIVDPLEARFANKPLFLQLILALSDRDHAMALRDCRCAQH